MKICTGCNTAKSREKFSKNGKARDGLDNRCKDCRKAYRKEYYRKNHEKEKRLAKEWASNNRDKRREYSRKYDYNNKDKRRKYYLKNKKVIAKKKREYDRQWRLNNPLKKKANTQRYRSRLKQAPGIITDKDIRVLARHQKSCVSCQRTFNEKLPMTLDHVIPLSKGGTNNPSNIIGLCGSCNSSKGDRMPHEYAETLTFPENNLYRIRSFSLRHTIHGDADLSFRGVEEPWKW